jgi:glycosyltransferase involved in cell wall biosynthesis
MIQAFILLGHKVTLLAKDVKLPDEYAEAVVKNFYTSYSPKLLLKCIFFLRKNHHDIWFIREPRILLFALLYQRLFFLRKHFILYEIHDMPRDYFEALALRWLNIHMCCIVPITERLAKDMMYAYSIDQAKILVLPDGVDLEKFKVMHTKKSAQKKIGFTKETPLVVYTGNLYEWKGVDVLAKTAKFLPDVTFLFVGGKEHEVDLFKKKYIDSKNIMVQTYQPHSEIPVFLQAADLLILPNTSTDRMSNLYTSPLKLFEYMASKVPIIASNIPSIREVLIDGVNSYLVKPDDAELLAEKIKYALHSDNKKITETAFVQVQSYTWLVRAKEMIRFVNNNYTHSI